MYYLIYTSYGVNSFKEDKDFKDLLLQCRENNTRLNITGMLYYFNDSFIQLIEGEEKAVRELYQKIRTDKRHKHAILLKEGNSEKRFFPDWTMGYRHLTKADPEISINSEELREGVISTTSVLKLFDIAAEKSAL